jgi:hypothetical protein
MIPRLLLAAALVAALAGCSDAPAATGTDPAADAADAANGAGPGHSADGMAHAEQAAPAWQVGQWWDHHWYFGPQDTQGFMVKAIVVGNDSAGWRLATDEAIDAASHAAFYFHDQGTMGPDWSVRDFGGAFQFPWYSFPLHDGKTWTAHEENLDFNLQKLSQQLTLKATAINGTPGAFSIEARAPDGLRALYDYQPSIGWFSEYRAYAGGATDPAQYNLRMVDEGHGRGYAGTVYTATADFLLDTASTVAPTAPAAPAPPASFTVTESHTDVLAIPFVFAAAGASTAELAAPDGRHWEAYQVTDHTGSVVQGQQPGIVFVPAAPGDWRFATAGAGAFVAGGGCFAWGITLTSATL